MLSIQTSRESAKALADQIHQWRKVNIPGYNATSWANCDLPDEEYDKLFKHQLDDTWFVPIPVDMDMKIDGLTVDELPKGWRDEQVQLEDRETIQPVLQ